MAVVGVLAVALGALVLGLASASPGWLFGSLAASALAAVLLWSGRRRVPPAAGVAADRVWVVPGAGRYHRGDCDLLVAGAVVLSRDRAAADGLLPCSLCAP
jgi:hypothetical protein